MTMSLKSLYIYIYIYYDNEFNHGYTRTIAIFIAPNAASGDQGSQFLWRDIIADANSTGRTCNRYDPWNIYQHGKYSIHGAYG